MAAGFFAARATGRLRCALRTVPPQRGSARLIQPAHLQQRYTVKPPIPNKFQSSMPTIDCMEEATFN